MIRFGLSKPEISCEVFAISPVNVALICGYADNADHPNISGEIRIWNLLTSEYSASQRFSSSVRSIESTRDGTFIVGTDFGEASSWRFDGKWNKLVSINHSTPVVTVAFAEERMLACSASSDGLLIVWHLLNGTPFLRTYIDIEPVIVGFLQQGQSLCMVDRSGEVHVWEIEGYNELPHHEYSTINREGQEYSSTLVQRYLNVAAHLSCVQELYDCGELNDAKLLLEALPDVPNAQEIRQYWQTRINREHT